MTTFTIDGENNITAFTELPVGFNQVESFSTAKELAKLIANWPASRVTDTWNSFAGVAPFDDLKPVKKFTDRKAAAGRLWMAVQRLTPIAAPHVDNDATETTDMGTDAAGAKKPARANTTAKTGKAVRRAEVATARDGSKKAVVLDLLKRPNGASLKEIMAATGWQAHSVRGFISGALGKKMGLAVESTRREDGERLYQLR